jgi:hypothetical protein
MDWDWMLHFASLRPCRFPPSLLPTIIITIYKYMSCLARISNYSSIPVLHFHECPSNLVIKAKASIFNLLYRIKGRGPAGLRKRTCWLLRTIGYELQRCSFRIVEDCFLLRNSSYAWCLPSPWSQCWVDRSIDDPKLQPRWLFHC